MTPQASAAGWWWLAVVLNWCLIMRKVFPKNLLVVAMAESSRTRWMRRSREKISLVP